MLSISQIAATHVLAHRKLKPSRPKRQLWDEALGHLDEKDPSRQVLQTIGAHVKISEVQAVVQQRLDECVGKQWEYTKSNGEKVVVRRQLEKIFRWVNKFKDAGDVAIQYDPAHAALPWAAVRFVLQAAINNVETFSAMLQGVEVVAELIVTYAEVERLLIIGASKLKTQLANSIVNLYASILGYLGKASAYFNQRTLKRIFKDSFQPSQMTVTTLLDRVHKAELEVRKFVELVQAEDQKNQLSSLRWTMQEVLDSVTNIKLSGEDKRHQVHGWLKALSSAETYQRALTTRHEGTCDWMLQKTAFEEWISPTSQIGKAKLLWIHGGPGFGKTILSARLVEYLITHTTMPVVYFFCVADEEGRREPYAILRSWIDQLVQCSADALDIAFAALKPNEIREPTTAELWKIFRTLARTIQCVFAIDGFDECTAINKASRFHTGDGRAQFLQSLIKEAKETKARILIVSRDNDDIRGPLNHLSIDKTPKLYVYAITPSDTKEDLYSCSVQLVHDKLARKSTKLKDEIAADAARGSDGMFLWLHLVVRGLDPGENAKRLRQVVAEMPSEINDTYAKDLERVNSLKPDQKKRAVAILRWILFAVRPLTVRELAEAIALGADEVADEYPEDDLPDDWKETFVDDEYVNTFIRRSCGSLVELRSKKPDQPVALHTVHFVHYSVKEYLLRQDHTNHDKPMLEAICFPNGVMENDRLARLCLQYLCYDVFGEKDEYRDMEKIRIYPFLFYAARAWHTHALRDHRISDDIATYAQRLFNPATSNWILWSKVFEGELDPVDDVENVQENSDSETDEDYIPESDTDSDYSGSVSDEDGSESDDDGVNSEDDENTSAEETTTAPNPVYYASLLGLTDIVASLQSQGFKCDEPGGQYGFPLQAAVVNGHEQTVKYLIEQGVDVSQTGGRHGSALGAAASTGSHRMFSILWRAGANVKEPNHHNINALYFACASGAIDLVKMVLKDPAELLQNEELGLCPYYAAVDSNNPELISFLLDQGLDPNVKDNGGESILHYAAEIGLDDIVKVLLKRGAAADAADAGDFIVLHAAVKGDGMSTVRLILEKNVDVNRASKGVTALHYAAMRAKGVECVTLLLDHGVDIHASTDDGWSPLHLAAQYGNEELVSLLLARGAEVDAGNSADCTSLFTAVYAGHLSAVQILVEHGADINKVEVRGETVLDMSLERGTKCKHVTEWLIDHHALCKKVEPNAESILQTKEDTGWQRSCQVQQALFGGDEELALRLMDVPERSSQTVADNALLAAALFGSATVVDAAILQGANLGIKTSNLRTPLHLVAHRGYSLIVAKLIDHSANIRASDITGSEPLDLAVSEGLSRTTIVKDFLEQGALATVNESVNDETQQSALEGVWTGTYTYSSWMKGRVDKTGLTVKFEANNNVRRPPLWTCKEADEVGNFEIYGHLLSNNVVRFVKLYDKMGWLYLGHFDPQERTIEGTWGRNKTLRHGSFILRKSE